MALDYTVGTVQTSSSTASSPIDFSHDNGGAGLLLVAVSFNRSTTPTISVDYDSVPMTLIAQADFNSTFRSVSSALFLLENPSSGSNTVSVTFSGSAVVAYVIMPVAITGYKPGDLIGSDIDTIIGSSATHNIGITTDEDGSDLILFGCCRRPVNAIPLAPDSGTTKLDESTSDPSGVIMDIVAGLFNKTIVTAGAGDIGCTSATSQRRAFIGFELKAVSGVTASLLLMQESFRK